MKGTMISQFAVGERVLFHTNVGGPVYKRSKDKEGKPIHVYSHKRREMRRDHGRIVKLHKSGSFGVAEIKPECSDLPGTEGRKVSRRLQNVEKA